MFQGNVGLHNNGVETTAASEAANHKEAPNEESNKTGLVKVRILTCCADNRHRISPSSFGSFLKFHRFSVKVVHMSYYYLSYF